MIDVYIQEIETCLKNRCYFAALALTLTLPDICGAAEYPDETSVAKRYISWYDKYIGDYERKECNTENESYLSGEIVYNLRNTFLHQGNPTIDPEKVKEEKNRFDRFALDLNDKTVTYSINISISIGPAIIRMISIKLTYLCEIICTAALHYYKTNGSKILEDIKILPPEDCIPTDYQYNLPNAYSAITQILNAKLHQNGINVSVPESRISDTMDKMISQSAKFISEQSKLAQYLDEISHGSISDEDKDTIINIVFSSKSKQEIHTLFQKAFGNTAAKEYYKMIKPRLKNHPGKAG